jgi:hypothetical protein
MRNFFKSDSFDAILLCSMFAGAVLMLVIFAK